MAIPIGLGEIPREVLLGEPPGLFILLLVLLLLFVLIGEAFRKLLLAGYVLPLAGVVGVLLVLVVVGGFILDVAPNVGFKVEGGVVFVFVVPTLATGSDSYSQIFRENGY